jgi:hypothetical protein
MKDIRELATAIVAIDWAGLEDGNETASKHFHSVRNEIFKLDKADAINLLLEVMQARVLEMMYPRSIYSELLQFNRMYHSYSSFGENKNENEGTETDLWYQLFIKIDTMAKYRDNKHFGLPMGSALDLIEPLKQEFLINKKISK